jgi:GR25 family glycosyltransferase involved in LPS biosynthesis
MKLNDFFDKIYIITCDESSDRRNYIQSHFDHFDIRFQFVKSWKKAIFADSTRSSASNRSLTSGCIKCVWDAKINRFGRILICEDDVCLIEDYEHKFNNFINILPDDWDFMQLGNQFWATHWLVRNKIKDNLYKFLWGTGAHCIGIKNSAYDPLLESLEKFALPLDFLYYELYKTKNCYCPESFIADALSNQAHLNYHSEKYKFKSTISHTT